MIARGLKLKTRAVIVGVTRMIVIFFLPKVRIAPLRLLTLALSASTSVSSSRINDSDAKPTSFNDASPCVESRLEEDNDIKCLHVDRVFPSVPAIHVLSSSKAEGQEGDIIHTPLDTTETATATDSGQGETPMIVDSWQAFMDKQDNKGQDSNEHQNMSAPQGEPLGLVPPSSTYRVSWQESNKNKAYSHHHHHHQPFEQHGNKRSTSLYYNDDAAPHFRHDTSTHTTPHLSYGTVKQQEIAPSVVTRSDDISSSNYQRTTSGSGESTSPSRNKTSSHSPQLQYGQSDGTARSNSYPDNPHATGTYFSHHPAKWSIRISITQSHRSTKPPIISMIVAS
jgi:hypothetical protein